MFLSVTPLHFSSNINNTLLSYHPVTYRGLTERGREHWRWEPFSTSAELVLLHWLHYLRHTMQEVHERYGILCWWNRTVDLQQGDQPSVQRWIVWPFQKPQPRYTDGGEHRGIHYVGLRAGLEYRNRQGTEASARYASGSRRGENTSHHIVKRNELNELNKNILFFSVSLFLCSQSRVMFRKGVS